MLQKHYNIINVIIHRDQRNKWSHIFQGQSKQFAFKAKDITEKLPWYQLYLKYIA